VASYLGPNVRPSVPHVAWAPDEERELCELVASSVENFEQGIGPDFRDRCNTRYRQYRSFSKFRDAWIQGSANDRDEQLRDAKTTWGAHLHIPLSFRTIETTVPRAIAHRPRMLYLPRQERWAENVEAVRLLIDSQQDQIDIDLPFQAVMRSGRIYGLGVGKCYWRKETAVRRRVKRRTFSTKFQVGGLEQQTVFDDPMFEDVDPFDFMWDPFGSDTRPGASGRCRWVVHRVWLSLEDCLRRVEDGRWATASARGLNEDELRRLGSSNKYDEVWQERMEASGFSSLNFTARGEQIHELHEWHDGERVLSVLDRTLLVQDEESQCVGTLPFQVYRPTPLQRQMVGIGDLEPLEHLQRELDTLRSQRRDSATLALAAGYAYDTAAISEEDLIFGPHMAIPVDNARPSDALFPIPRNEPPGTSYEEEKIIRQDFDTVIGLSDALDPSPGGTVGTATEAQLVQAALGRRIELASRRFEIEVVRHAAKCFLYLDQRMILEPRDVKQPDHGVDYAQAREEGRWRWVTLDPGALQGEFEIVPEGGSMAARNIPQDRQDGLQIMQVFGQNPFVDPRRPLLKALELFGVKDPEGWLKQTEPPVPPLALRALENMGVDRRLIQRAVQVAQQTDPRLNPDQPTPDEQQQQQGPNVEQVDQMMSGAPA
jgi:hypothetical protein